MKIKKLLFKLLFIIITMLFVFLLTTKVSKANNELSLYNLKFDVLLNQDGSMDVTETWRIHIEDTNTLYKTFKLDSSKYSKITDVKIIEITSMGKNKLFTKINQEMYHVTKDCYYSLINSKGLYEIAWGVSVTNNDIKTYKISYKVNDVVKIYNDCAEIYWQFIGNEFEIPAGFVKGTIILPKDVEKKENIKVWAHGQLNGMISILNTNTVEFQIDNFIPGNFVEVRILTPPELFPFR